MLTAWKQWCRLCAKEDGDVVDIFARTENFINIPEAIQKFFLIAVSPCDETPKMICYSCYMLLKNLVNFSERASRVDAMFSELIFQKYNMVTEDPETLRYQLGLSQQDVGADCGKSDKATDTSDLLVEFLPENEEASDDRSQLFTILINNSNDSDDRLDEDDHEDDNKVPEFENLRDKIKTEQEDGMEQIEVIPAAKISNPDDIINVDADYIDEEYLDIKSEDEGDQPNVVNAAKSHVRRGKSPRKLRPMQPIKCEACDKEFSRAGNFRQHMKICPLTTKPALYPCSKCEKHFPTEKRLQQHEATHLPPEQKTTYPCRFCDKKFTKAVNVTAHVKAVHIGEKPFICEQCGKTFTTKGALKEHKYTHVEETPYQCSKCPKKFKNLPRLKTHEDTHNDTIYVCPHCGLQLNTKRTLQMHMVVHSDQKKYKCNYCGNEYKRSKALKNHLILHTGLRPYTCPFCDKTFTNGSNCRSHKKKAHPLELAAMEAAGQKAPATNIPKLEQLKAVAQATQPLLSPNHNIFDQIEVSLNAT